MAIDVNPLNVSALAALAGNSYGNLGLAVPDYLTPRVKMAEVALARLGLLQKQNEADLDRQAMLTNTSMQVQGQQQLAQMGAQAQAAQLAKQQQFQAQQAGLDRAMKMKAMQQDAMMQQQQIDQQGMYQQGQLANQGRGLDLQSRGLDLQEAQDEHGYEMDKKKLQMLQMQMMLKSRADLQKQELNKRGAFASLVLAGAQGLDAKNPEAFADYMKKKLDYGYKNGILSKEEYEQGLNTSPQEAMQHAVMDLMMSSYAQEAKDNPMVMKALNIAINGSPGSSDLTQAQQSKQQEKIIANKQQLNQLYQLRQLIKDNPDVFTTAGNAFAEGNAAANRNAALKPFLNTAAKLMGYDPQKLDDAATDIDALAAGSWGDIAKNLSPRLIATSGGEFKKNMMPSISDSWDNAVQKADRLIKSKEQQLDLDQEFLKKGKIPSAEDYDKLIQSVSKSGSSSPKSFTFKGKKVNIDKIMKANPGMSSDDIMKYLEENS